ncbi:hypothetical protein HPP92_018006 [Vanilla planifolia]|uniref:Uncharacterized protein n=1 Tax=Vanilla planifolia TaxID=51239 RepID=A0A835QH69_VANPL|nr:hypothetical protein HPP92_018006 [Vanilla planifolia]
MENFAEVCHRESIKKTIIKHEEVFKKQVNELHRLYKVQKKLMWEMRVKEMKNMRPLQLTSKAHNVENKDTTETSRSSYGSVRNTSESTPVHRCSAMAAVRIAHELSNYSEGPSKVSDGFHLRRLNDEGDSLDLTLSICRTSEKIRGEDWKKISEETTKEGTVVTEHTGVLNV